jgi:hypothetical protein
MRYYQPIGKISQGNWTNFDTDYFDNFTKAKEFIVKKAEVLRREYNLSKIGLDVFDPQKENYLPMFWEYNNNWARNYKD